jgi:hypothetical protein
VQGDKNRTEQSQSNNQGAAAGGSAPEKEKK